MADQKKTDGQKCKAQKPKAEKPQVLSGTVPEWASTAAISKLLGKGTRRIQQLTQDGVLETEVPPGGGRRKYRTCETIKRYIAHVEQKTQGPTNSGRASELALKKLEAEVKLKESQGQLHQIKTAIAEGKYIPAERAAEELAEFMSAFKKFAMNIPVRTAGAISGEVDALTVRALEKAMRKELETMLNAFLDTIKERESEAET